MSKARNLATLLSSDGSVKTTKYADSVGGQSTFVASGTLPNGAPVILNSDGTVSLVGTTVADETMTLDWIEGSYTTLSDTGLGNTTVTAIAYDPHTQNRVVLAYIRSGLRLVIGTISGTTITFGTEVLAAGGSVGGPFEIDVISFWCFTKIMATATNAK